MVGDETASRGLDAIVLPALARSARCVPYIGEQMLGARQGSELRAVPPPAGDARRPAARMRPAWWNFSMGWRPTICTRTLADRRAE